MTSLSRRELASRPAKPIRIEPWPAGSPRGHARGGPSIGLPGTEHTYDGRQKAEEPPLRLAPTSSRGIAAGQASTGLDSIAKSPSHDKRVLTQHSATANKSLTRPKTRWASDRVKSGA